MDQVREVLRYYHYAYRTEDTYCQWIRRYIRFYGNNIQPRELNSKHIEPLAETRIFLNYFGKLRSKYSKITVSMI